MEPDTEDLLSAEPKKRHLKMVWAHGKMGYRDFKTRKGLESSLIDGRSTASGAKLSPRNVCPSAGGGAQTVRPGHPEMPGYNG